MKQMKRILFLLAICALCMSSKEVKAEDTDFTKATRIELGVKTPGEILEKSEKDFYVFTTLGDNSYYELNIINTNIPGGVVVKLWNGEHTKELLYFGAENHSTKSNNIKLEPNVNYYIEVSSDQWNMSTGDYKVTITEIPDDGYGTMENATKIATNKTYSKTIEVLGDEDWYYFKTNSTTDTYSIKLINKNLNEEMRCAIYDEDGVLIYNNFGVNKNDSYTNTYKLNKNSKYYVSFLCDDFGYTSTGDYKFSISESLTLNKSSVIISKNKTTNLKATFTGMTDSVSGIKWSSSNKKIITVTSNGTIKGIGKGTAKVTCKYVLKDGITITRTCTVTVK